MYIDPGRADRIISRLGEFLRWVIQLSDRTTHTLAEEIELAKKFTQIMQERYPDKLTVGYQIFEEVFDKEVPVLLLQPLIENAIQYSVDYSSHTQVCIYAKLAEEGLILEIRDNGPGIELGKLSYGTGLTSTLQRLEAMYGDDHEVHFRNREEGGLTEIMYKYT